MLLLAWIISFAHAEDAWLSADVEALRWPDKPYVSASFTRGDYVEVLLRDGDKVRVRKENDFGWVPAADISTIEVKPAPPMLFPGIEDAPAVPSPVPAGLPGAPAPAAPAPQ